MIAIKDMEMPNSCEVCKFTENEEIEYFCKRNNFKDVTVNVENKDRDSDCPLVEIITCKECKHLNGLSTCEKLLVMMYDDCFCCFGERRE